jgi:hypothetical protein
MKYRIEEHETKRTVKMSDDLQDAIFHANYHAGTTETGVYQVIENDTNTVVYAAGIEAKGIGARFDAYIVDQYAADDFEETKARLYA